jgi:hypothetical protein
MARRASAAAGDAVTELLHIGYHKTGTTWLQRDVFAGGVPGFALPWHRGVLNDAFVTVNDLDFSAERARALLAERRAVMPPSDAAVDVVSHERLSGNPHSGGYDSRAIASRLRATFPDARVLAVIRRQSEMVLSAYKQYVREGGAQSIDRYLHPPHRGRARVPQFSLSFFEYDRLIACYHDLFGADRVLVLPYEQLDADPLAFVQRIAAFGGVPEPASVAASRRNVGLSGTAVGVKRRFNFWFARDTVNPAAPFDWPRVAHGVRTRLDRIDPRLPARLRRRSDRRLDDVVRAETDGRFAESNRRTATLTGLDLASLGYESDTSGLCGS